MGNLLAFASQGLEGILEFHRQIPTIKLYVRLQRYGMIHVLHSRMPEAGRILAQFTVRIVEKIQICEDVNTS